MLTFVLARSSRTATVPRFFLLGKLATMSAIALRHFRTASLKAGLTEITKNKQK